MTPADDPAPSPRRSVDENGRIIPLSPEEARRRAAEAIAALDAMESIGDEEEQRQTLEMLMRELNEHPMSYRLRFREESK